MDGATVPAEEVAWTVEFPSCQVKRVPKPLHRVFVFVAYFVDTFVERIGPFTGIPTKFPTKFPPTLVHGTSSKQVG